MGQYTIWRPGMLVTDDRLNAARPVITPYTPVWGSTGTAPALGNGTILGQYARLDYMVWVGIWMTTGSTSTYGTGSYNWTVPITSAGAQITPVTARLAIGGGSGYVLAGQVGTSDSAIRFLVGAGTGGVGAGIPAAWTTGTSIVISGWYPAAA